VPWKDSEFLFVHAERRKAEVAKRWRCRPEKLCDASAVCELQAFELSKLAQREVLVLERPVVFESDGECTDGLETSQRFGEDGGQLHELAVFVVLHTTGHCD